MRIAILSPIAWRTPPRSYGPWENIASLLTEGLVARGHEVTLFATGDSYTSGTLHAVCQQGYEEDASVIPKVCECLHISALFEQADTYDIIHNHFDFLPLTYTSLITTPVVTTIHGFSSAGILPVYKKYNGKVFYVSISDADRSPEIDYVKTIHHGIDINQFDFQPDPEDYLLFFGRFHPDKGAKEAIEIAQRSQRKLIMAGIIQDKVYFKKFVKPFIDNDSVIYVGCAGPEERNKLLGNAAALLHPINFDEPFGLAVIESMSCGTPVIAFNRGSMPELIQDRRNGFLVSNIDEAITAIRNLKEINRAYCRRFVEDNFTIDHMVDKYVELYETILEQTKLESRRPWGTYQVISNEETYKCKRIVVHPGKRLSLQRHQQRDEHWFVLSGEAWLTVDDYERVLTVGNSVDIRRNSLHRIKNSGLDDLVFLEVQTGDYFGEDDIERLHDDFGRV